MRHASRQATKEAIDQTNEEMANIEAEGRRLASMIEVRYALLNSIICVSTCHVSSWHHARLITVK